MSAILESLRRFVASRSGIEWVNYGGSREAFMQDYRTILRHGRDARAMPRAAELCRLPESVLVDVLRSGRLTWDGSRLDYCAGQYYPTEYRAAACRALASALWAHWRGDAGTCETIRAEARRSLGQGIARRWFD